MHCTEAIGLLLKAKRQERPELSDYWTPSMETQILVARGDGEPVDGKTNTFTDGVRQWHPIRIPKNADGEPTFDDNDMHWSLEVHAEAVGSTGWDWKERKSRWVGYDFDDMVSHSAGTGITTEELEAVKLAAMNIPWVEIRKSTGGGGLHLYVRFDPLIETANHTEHAALARAVLGLLGTEANFDFASQIDICGGNMWLWHRKMTPENEGLKLLKAAEGAPVVPVNWRDHVHVVTRKRLKIQLGSVSPGDQSDFETLATSRTLVPLDDKHKLTIQKLAETGKPAIWVPDYHLLQTHTDAFAEISKECRESLGLLGFFKTESSGSTPINCFALPLPDGAWKICRFGRGVREAQTWQQDGVGWTWCYFNRAPDLATASTAMGGTTLPDSKGYEFDSALDAAKTAKAIGSNVEIPQGFENRKAVLRENKDGRLVTSFIGSKTENRPAGGWTYQSGWWSNVTHARTNGHEEEEDYDHLLRVVVTPSGSDAGLFVASSRGWDQHNQSMAKMVLQHSGKTKNEAEQIIGGMGKQPWELVSIPFAPEYPGGRKWNSGAPQLRYPPATSRENLSHPHWDRIFNHCGQSLTPYLASLEWAGKAGVQTGGDYLRCWFATILQEPFARLPYLFFYGPEKSGKSTLWMAFRDALVRGGVARAERAITNGGEFNAELKNAVLCVMEERDFSKADGALNKLRDYVTATDLTIHEKFKTVYTTANATHFIQISNSWQAVPLAEGDTRITVFSVPLFGGVQIPWDVLLERLRAEAPAFLRTLLDLELPEKIDRLRLPVVETEHKQRIALGQRTDLEQFIAEACYAAPGASVAVADFYEAFQKWLPESERPAWGKIRTMRGLPPHIPRGAGSGNIRYIGNYSLTNEPVSDARPWTQIGDKLIREDIDVALAV